MPETNTIQLEVKSVNETSALFGPNDKYLKRIEELLGVTLITRGEEVVVTNGTDKMQLIHSVFEALLELIRNGITISERDIVYIVQLAGQDRLHELLDLYDEKVAVNAKGKPIIAKTLGQRHYVSAIRKKDMVFGIGPAGTGKTYLAVVMAVTSLKNGDVKRIVLTRPAVEAGESQNDAFDISIF